ncbi:MAG: Rpn family recombination-promoting nuclease/putative transposase [Caldilineaceae bacterium]|nr:Rpn family recombination-promoting nuclease/putative transposase [Caldilineaceae bacterium]MBP8121598.1 Rpn family recombination-promoting nuclease/putative transposase [Caldilineaceae bacterium]MBP9072511.1 Rpn family recombination-promoting nuclease/putative transposase [Caldilineaceae bacterium]
MNIHDSGYKRLFSNKTIFRQLMQTFVTEPWVKDLDFEQMETVDKSFVSDHYKETESDLIYRVGLHGREVYIYVLLEFQSTVDRWMAVRMLNYITDFYMDYIAARKDKDIVKLPAVFPMLLYNGDRSWTAPVNIAELIESEPSLGRYGLNFEYFKIVEHEFSREQLLGIRNIVSTLFLAEAHYDIEVLIAELPSLFAREDDRQAASLFLNWFRQLWEHGRVAPADYAEIEESYRSTEEAREMLLTALEKEREAFRREGFEQGIEQGADRKQRELVCAMHVNGYAPDAIAHLFGLTVEQVNALLINETPDT